MFRFAVTIHGAVLIHYGQDSHWLVNIDSEEQRCPVSQEFRISSSRTPYSRRSSCRREKFLVAARVEEQAVLANNFTVSQFDQPVRQHKANGYCDVVPGGALDPWSGGKRKPDDDWGKKVKYFATVSAGFGDSPVCSPL